MPGAAGSSPSRSLLAPQLVRLVLPLADADRRVEARLAEALARVEREDDHRDLRGRIGVVLLRQERHEPVVEAELVAAGGVLAARVAELGRAGLPGDGQLRVRHRGGVAGDDLARALADRREVL